MLSMHLSSLAVNSFDDLLVGCKGVGIFLLLLQTTDGKNDPRVHVYNLLDTFCIYTHFLEDLYRLYIH